MTGYILGFSVYTLAMIGVIFVAFVVAKKCLAMTPHKNKTEFLKIENCLNIEPRKNLYVVKAGREKFLISTSGEHCHFMTKLDVNNFNNSCFERNTGSIAAETSSIQLVHSDKHLTGIF
ncbi:MAG TPA: flagellar biosynthetic protein FliO [Candidatus Gastranaerophilales bacterium]|nr:flagellar biosynthetic protein FliO [Candidatus Gastranaerophilales bacterium]